MINEKRKKIVFFILEEFYIDLQILKNLGSITFNCFTVSIPAQKSTEEANIILLVITMGCFLM